ncbi:aspartate kinase [Candidatus Borrarchaeum sp.]|uniref:aspartate kinase n=1 Tax=Candidatus Borrarchaeum sp. TaxID=2846742 RepID=UPI00257AE457|nr:aspartate kinase [Candidatus Borrarchaeum sp.]
MRVVMKFGGTSIGNGSNFGHVAKIINSYAESHETIVLVSAMAGVTDQLIDCAERSQKDITKEVLRDFIQELLKKHLKAAEESIDDEFILKEVEQKLTETLEELERVLIGISLLKELSSQAKDKVMSFGERLSTPILWGAVKNLNIPVVYLTGYEAGIVTDERFGNARPIWNISIEKIQKTLVPLLEQRYTIIISGFIAGTEDGLITTLGRGGTDFSAAIIGTSIEADEIIFWKETTGVLTTDPNLEPNAQTIPSLSYAEAMELAYFGAKILHPKCLQPVMERENILVRVKNTFKPDAEGSIIVPATEQVENVAKAVSVLFNAGIIEVGGAEMIGTPGIAAHIFGAFEKADANVIMISQSSSEANISVVVNRSDIRKTEKVLKETFAYTNYIKYVRSEDDICVIGVVGEGLKGTPGVAAKVFQAVAQKGVNVRMIAQGSSELNISFVVKEKDGGLAVRALHEAFELGKKIIK